MNQAISSDINPLLVIEIAIEMIDDLITNYSKVDLIATRGFIYSIEGIIPLSLVLKFYQLIANIEISHERKR